MEVRVRTCSSVGTDRHSLVGRLLVHLLRDLVLFKGEVIKISILTSLYRYTFIGMGLEIL